MTDHRARIAGRKSPTFNPARASMPVNIGYNLPYTGELHAVPTGRYDAASVPRRHDPKAAAPGPSPATATVTTYNVAKEPVSRSLSRSNRNRASTVDSHTNGKPIIVTTNHARPHVPSNHTPSSARPSSPSRESYRPNDDTYYNIQPASSIRSRSHNRHSYSQGAPLGDEYYRLRERVGGAGGAPVAGDAGYWGPTRVNTNTDTIRNPRPHVLYTAAAYPTHAAAPTHHAAPAHHAAPSHHATPSHHSTPSYASNPAIVDYESDYYEYTKPGELVRYDLDHDRRGRRESVDHHYYRPRVDVVSHDTTTRHDAARLDAARLDAARLDAARHDAARHDATRHDATRHEPRSRTKPPPSGGLERFNRTTAATAAYDRPSVTMPAPPAVPPPPPIDTTRRPALLEGPRSPSGEGRTTRPRPVSLYQDGPTRPSHTDDSRRSRDDERVGKDRRAREDGYRDEGVASRGFGIRTDTLDQHSSRSTQNYDERRSRHEIVDRESKRGSEESLGRVRTHDRECNEDRRSRIEDRKDTASRRESVSRTRDRVAEFAAAAVAAAGLAPPSRRDEANVSPRRRDRDEEKEQSRPRERDTAERKSFPGEDRTNSETRREPRRERTESVSGSKDRAPNSNVDREPEPERERERERQRDREDERDQRERQRQDAEAKLNGSSADKREGSPDDTSNNGRRRQKPSSAFDPTDTKGLMDLKAELAALDNQNQGPEKADESDVSSTKESGSVKTPPTANGSDRGDESADESRGREIVPAREEKQVRVVSPPRDKTEQKPIKGILKTPKAKFPEDTNPIREGVAPHKDDPTKKDVPPGARWTKISRKKVNPEALTIGKERFEVRDDFVIVLRVLNKEEIQAYATATAQIREVRRKEFEKDSKGERYSDSEQTRSDEERQRRHRHRQEKEDEEYRRRPVDDRQRRHKYDDDKESRPKTIEYPSGHHRHYDSNAEDRR